MRSRSPRSRRRRLVGLPGAIGASAALLLVCAVAAGAQTADQPARALSIEYANGRATLHPLRPSWRMWTPAFPRMPGAETARDGLPLSALHVSYAVDGPRVLVTVGLAYGSPNNTPVPVARVSVQPGRPVQVGELRAFGVEPITFSLRDISVGLLLPAVVSASASIDARIDTVAYNLPVYRLSIRNLSTQPLMSLRFQGFRGDHRALTGMKRGERNLPLIQPGEEHAFEISISQQTDSAGAEPQTWRSFDRLVITYVKWQDGLVEGELPVPDIDTVLYASRAAHIKRVLAVLRRGDIRGPAELHAAIGALNAIDSGALQVTAALRSDLRQFEQSFGANDSAAFAAWLLKEASDFEQWFARIARH